jgi:hypothetical protein
MGQRMSSAKVSVTISAVDKGRPVRVFEIVAPLMVQNHFFLNLCISPE